MFGTSLNGMVLSESLLSLNALDVFSVDSNNWSTAVAGLFESNIEDISCPHNALLLLNKSFKSFISYIFNNSEYILFASIAAYCLTLFGNDIL